MHIKYMLRIQMQYSQFKPLPALENSVNLVLYTCSSLQNKGFECEKGDIHHEIQSCLLFSFSLLSYFSPLWFDG